MLTRLVATPPCVVLALCALGACAPEAPQELLAPDPATPGALGERGPYGAEVVRRSLDPAEGSAVDAEVFVPVGGESPGPFPVVIFLQGGAVPVERYRWLGAHLASRGVVVASPTHPFDFAILATDSAVRALEGLRAASDDDSDALAGLIDDVAIVCGHSLGGVVAAKAWLASPSFSSLALFASYPDEGDDFTGRAGRVMSIAGGGDAKADLADVVDGAAAFESAQLAVVDGMTHYQWTDGATESEIDSDAPPTLPDEQVRVTALTFVDALVAEAAGGAPWPFQDPAQWPAGASVPP